MSKITLAAVGAAALAFTIPDRADACGCVAPPDPTVPLVQAGERIVFDHDGTHVTAHIQIQYDGAAGDFGWLVPVPAVPEFAVGTDELFTQLIAQTQPRYRLDRQFDDQCGFENVALSGGVPRQSADEDAADGGAGGPLVLEDTAGPFAFAVLRADDKDEMVRWLNENEYFIPPGTTDDDVIGPYIRPGAFFLALKLAAGEEAGSIQPIVIRYESQYPMIPIILTSVAADPDMGIQVWVLGEERAIPRNYRHTVLNEEHIDWFNAGQNYNDVVIAATNEAEDGQSFVTEFAGSTERMAQQLYFEGRFPSADELASITDPALFVDRVIWSFPPTSAVVSVLQAALPVPPRFVEQGYDPVSFYQSAFWLFENLRQTDPEAAAAWGADFDPAALTATLVERVVEPTRQAQQLLDDNPMMTRLYTTLSPEEMTADPVFAFNPNLPDVSNEHVATFRQDCDGTGGVLQLPDGREFRVGQPADWGARPRPDVPFSARIERLAEEGPATVVIDNQDRLSPGLTEDGGCACIEPPADLRPSLLLFALIGLALVVRRRAG
jgi:hypothetical protein